MKKTIITLILFYSIIAVTNAQKLYIGGNFFLNKSKHVHQDDDFTNRYTSLGNIEAIIKLKVPYVIPIETGFKIINFETEEDPRYYFLLPLKIYHKTGYTKFNLEVGAGFFYAFGMAQNKNIIGANISTLLIYDFTPNISMFFKAEYLKPFGIAYTLGPYGSPGTLGGGRSYGYSLSSTSFGIGVMFQILKDREFND